LSPPAFVSLLGLYQAAQMRIYSKLSIAAVSPRLHNSFKSQATTTPPAVEAYLGGSQ
jgi:hypothetical protein